MSRIKMMLMAMIATCAIGAVGVSQAQAHADNHGSFTVAVSPLLGNEAECAFEFNKSDWEAVDPPTTPASWFTEVEDVTPVSPCDVDGLDAEDLVLTKDANGGWTLTGSLDFTVDTIFGPITCAYNLNNVFGDWTYEIGPPDWKEFLVDGDSTASRVSGGIFCPNPAEFIDGWIHTDAE